MAAQAGAPGSMLELHRALLRLRRAHPALSTGEQELLPADPHVLGYARREGDDHALVALNLTGEARTLELPAWAHGLAVRLSTVAGEVRREGARLHLRPAEAVVLTAASL